MLHRASTTWVGLILLLLPMLTACGTPAETSSGPRATLQGESELVGFFRDAERETGVPAELLATVAWIQSGMSMNLHPNEQHAGDAEHTPAAAGLMGIGSAKLTSVEEASELLTVPEAEVLLDERTNVRAGAALLVNEARKAGIVPQNAAEWAPALAAYGGDALVEAALRLLAGGFTTVDDAGRTLEVVGTGEVVDDLDSVAQALGYPGARWSAAHSSNYSAASRGAGQIDYIVIHTIQGSYAGAISWFKNPSADVSAHYVVRSSDGQVTQMVDDTDIAWHDACFNSQTIGIEHEGYVDAPKKWYTPKMYEGSAKLTAWLCDKYGIPRDRNHIVGHGEAPDCSSHTDPGSGWDWPLYMKLVKNGGKSPKTLKAKVTKKSTNLKKYRGKKAHYQVCAGKDFRMAFSFKNTGSAVWKDVNGRGKNIGNDVFLVTANGKTDRLTGKKRFSVRLNKNRVVRGDRKAKNCSTKNGCKRTTFVEGSMRAQAPKKPGIYATRWRLRDYSKEWGKKSKGFGPKVELKIKVKECAPQICTCSLMCSDGSSHTVTTKCSASGKPLCDGNNLISKNPCTAGLGGASGTTSTDSEASGAASGEEDQGGDEDLGAEADLGGDDDQNGFTPVDEGESDLTDDETLDENGESLDDADDADFEEDGFDGDEDGLSARPDGSAGCVIASPGHAGAPGHTTLLLVAGVVGLVFSRRQRRATIASN